MLIIYFFSPLNKPIYSKLIVIIPINDSTKQNTAWQIFSPCPLTEIDITASIQRYPKPPVLSPV